MARAKILVANRSEIACRVFQACQEMGLPTVGLLAPGDEGARHVTYADQLIAVPSYLDAEAIARAASEAGVTHVHPGYGFLSERPAFARALQKRGIEFVGPRPEAMDQMGGKIPAKLLAEKLGVPTLSWALVKPGDDIKKAADRVGYPLLLKASAGGGGKGMRRVDRAADLMVAAESAAHEAQAAFGDGTLFLERMVGEARHIEVQVFGDGTGAGVHLHERECTLQRRHQKVWEEATAPHLSDQARKGLFESALKFVEATQYRSAGTIEFLVEDLEDGTQNFYFLEMNTRLQVEHPVSELVTGVDLVHAQLTQALEPHKPALTANPTARGHAIEVRLYAEDPAQGFAPTPGRIEKLRWPTGTGIRVESGIEEGQELGTQFDSLLGKIVVYAPTRATAIARMQFALADTVILGSKGFGSNQAYLQTIAHHPQVSDGRVTTAFLGREFENWAPALGDSERALLVSALKVASGGVSQAQSGSRAAAFPNAWERFQ